MLVLAVVLDPADPASPGSQKVTKYIPLKSEKIQKLLHKCNKHPVRWLVYMSNS